MGNAQSVRRRISCFAFFVLAINPLALIVNAAAENYPAHTVRFILPFGAASATDITARLFADRLTARWGKPVVNARAAMVSSPSVHSSVRTTIIHFCSVRLEHSPCTAMTPTSRLTMRIATSLPLQSVSNIILALSVSAALKINSVAELVALARAQPGKLNAAAASGISDFLLFGFFKSSGLRVAKVPYRDILQAPNDLAEGASTY